MEVSQSGPEAGGTQGIKIMRRRRRITKKLSEDHNRRTTRNSGVTEVIHRVLHPQRMEMVELFLTWLVSDLLSMLRNQLHRLQVKPTESTTDPEVSLMMMISGDKDCTDDMT